MKLATFDIFDTTLIRKCGRPEVVPYLVAMRLWPEDEMARCEYVNARRQAATKGDTISEIYKYVGLNTLPNYSGEYIMKAEMDMEGKMLKGVRGIKGINEGEDVREIIDRLRDEDWTIKFLSDMYLPSSFLAEILRREGCLKDDEEVIVSCEWGSRKDTGRLYKKVREKYRPEQWMHFGDNLRSDIKQAKRNGVKAFRIDSKFTELEKRIGQIGENSSHPEIYARLAGVMRHGRLMQSNTPSAILAADYIAPLYIPYVDFILKRARMMGIRRLHFLSRDGYIMQKIAEALNPEDIELNYLFVSRKSLIPAFLSIQIDDDPRISLKKRFLQITDRQHLIGRDVEKLLGQLQLTRKEMEDKYGITFPYYKILSKTQQEDFLKRMFDNEVLTADLAKWCEESRNLIIDYFRQERLTDNAPQAMVDIGWLGTTRLMVNEILKSIRLSNDRDIPTFYLGVRADVYPHSYGPYISYFPYASLSTEATALIENYYSASPWPSTIGYKREDGKIKPIFKDGQVFQLSPLIETNIESVCRISTELKHQLPTIEDNMLFNWAKTTLESLSKMEYPVDLSPMTMTSEFDGESLIKELSFLQLINMVLLGDRVTAFDRGSLAFTIGYKLSQPLWKLHKITDRVRSLAYRAFLKRK